MHRAARLALSITASAVLIAQAAALAPQARTVLVRVRADDSGAPLPNAEIIDATTGTRRFTNAMGEATLTYPSSGELQVRVRQLGYRFQDRRLVPTQPGDSAVFVLRRIAWALPSIATTASRHCPAATDPAAAALSAWTLEQLRQGAERYRQFRDAYPFEVHAVRRTARLTQNGQPSIFDRKERERSERWGDPYVPGHVVEKSSVGFSVPILFIAALADSVFWEHHCFEATGVENATTGRVVRLRFTRVPNATKVDWEGSALLDSATSLLRRVEFRLAGLDQSDVPKAFTGYTTFASPSPFIVMPDTTVAMWWRRERAPDEDWGSPDVAQMVYVERLRYRRAAPPAVKLPQ